MVAFDAPSPPAMDPHPEDNLSDDGYRPIIDVEYVGEAELVRMAEDVISRAKSGLRTRAELRWFVNCKWKANEPWYRQTTDGLLEWLKPDKRARYVNVNKSHEIVEALVGHQTFPPSAEVRPSTPDPADAFRARATRDLANHGIQTAALEETVGQVVEDIHVCGHGVIKRGWDPTVGPELPTYGAELCDVCQGAMSLPSGIDGLPVPCFKCTAQGQIPGVDVPKGHVPVETGRAPAGDVFVERRRPWSVYTDTLDLDNVAELVDEQWMNKSEAWLKYGSVVGLSEDDMETASTFNSEFPELASDIDTLTSETVNRDRVIVREYWKERSEKFPRGLYGIYIGSKVIFFGPMPDGYKSIPYEFIKGYEDASSPYPKSTMDYILPILFVMNDLVSALRARAVQSVKPRVKASYANNIKWEEKDGIGVLKYDPGIRGEGPQEFNLGAASSETSELIQDLLLWMDQISGATDAVKGESSSDATSAKMLGWLEDRAAVRFKRLRMRIVRGVKKTVRGLLGLMKEYYTDGRSIHVMGSSRGQPTLRAYKTMDIMDVADVVLDITPDQYMSSASRNQQVNDATQSGALDHPVASKLLEFGGLGEFYEMRALHEAKAVNENESLRASGMIDQPIEGEDHQIHMDTIFSLINELRMSDPQSPSLGLAMQHWKMHQQMKQQEQMQAAQVQAGAAQGFGMQGAADPGNQTPAAQEGAASTGTVPDEMQAQISGQPGAPGTQPSLSMAQQNAGSTQAA